ncbi:isochorismatase family protein [Peribacillus sp. NPDC046944]|uniref:isochorismatase family protein n=1 Tax=unclassified Peribacillus TaxID=2675266 RepID=UPI0037FF7B08
MSQSFEGFGDSSGFGSRPAIIVVDFIKGFTDTASALGSDLTSQLEATKKLLYHARSKAIPIVFTTVNYEPHFRDGGYFIKKVPALKLLTADSKWVNVDEKLERDEKSEPLIVKKFASSFFGTHLHSFLTSERVDTAIIVGCTTSGCVRATAVDALQYGFRVVVPEACVGDRSIEAHKANLYDIQTKYGDVTSLEVVIDYISQLN